MVSVIDLKDFRLFSAATITCTQQPPLRWQNTYFFDGSVKIFEVVRTKHGLHQTVLVPWQHHATSAGLDDASAASAASSCVTRDTTREVDWKQKIEHAAGASVRRSGKPLFSTA